MTKPETTTWRFYLQPLDRVQFGEERDPDRQDYYVASRPWPQQSALLGLLRFLLLQENDLLLSGPGDKWSKDQLADKVHPLIGPTSFTGHTDSRYGVIQELGPLSIWRKADNARFFACMDLDKGLTALTEKEMQAGRGSQSTGPAYDFAGFDPKKYIGTVLTDLEDNTLPLKDDGTDKHGRKYMDKEGEGVFFKFTTPGVVKTYAGDKEREDKEGHFYVTESYAMRRGFGFSFTASFAGAPSGSTMPAWTKRIVRFGSDGNPWAIHATKVGSEVEEKENAESKGSMFLLLTDARVAETLFDHCRAVVGDVQHFRNQRKSTRKDWAHHATDSVQLGDDQEQLKYEPSGLLLKRGTVLWAKDGKEGNVEGALQEDMAFRTIGYNHWHRFEQASDIIKASKSKSE